MAFTFATRVFPGERREPRVDFGCTEDEAEDNWEEEEEYRHQIFIKK
jgi:hypothetical protein